MLFLPLIPSEFASRLNRGVLKLVGLGPWLKASESHSELLKPTWNLAEGHQVTLSRGGRPADQVWGGSNQGHWRVLGAGHSGLCRWGHWRVPGAGTQWALSLVPCTSLLGHHLDFLFPESVSLPQNQPPSVTLTDSSIRISAERGGAGPHGLVEKLSPKARALAWC